MMNMDISNSEVAWKQESAGKVLNIHQNYNNQPCNLGLLNRKWKKILNDL